MSKLYVLAVIALGVALSTLVEPATAYSQTVFSEPSQKVDPGTYQYPDQCLSGIVRMARQEDDRDSVVWDTMPPDKTREFLAWSSPIIEFADACIGKYNPQSISFEYFRSLYFGYLVANRLSDALTYADRALSANREAKDSVYIQYVREIVDANLQNRPANLFLVDSLLSQLDVLSESVSRIWLCEVNWSLRQRAREKGDTAMAMRAAKRAEVSWLSLTDSERGSQWYQSRGSAAISNNAFINHKSRLDSLRFSMSGYVRLVQTQEGTILERGTGARASVVGSDLPSIEGEFWFPKKPVKPKPEAGKLSLVFAINFRCAQGEASSELAVCYRAFAQLRRIAQRFPKIDIIVLSYIEGHFLSQPMLSPEKEAELKRSWILEKQSVPATLVVEQGNFIQLPKPDGRFIDLYWTLPVMNAYTHGLNERRNQRGVSVMELTLVSDKGTVLWYRRAPSREDEELLTDIISMSVNR